MGGPLRDGAGSFLFYTNHTWIKNLLITEAVTEAGGNVTIRAGPPVSNREASRAGFQAEIHDLRRLKRREVILVPVQVLLIIIKQPLFLALAEREPRTTKVTKHLLLLKVIFDIRLP